MKRNRKFLNSHECFTTTQSVAIPRKGQCQRREMASVGNKAVINICFVFLTKRVRQNDFFLTDTADLGGYGNLEINHKKNS